jgi:hypothetical protein
VEDRNVSRIRSVKPEWLEDELVFASSDARVLSIALILLADDYGNGRAHPVYLLSRAFPGKVPDTLANALEELRNLRFVTLYEVDGQKYFSIRNWNKHQRVDKPGKAIIPGPPTEQSKGRKKSAKPPESNGSVSANIREPSRNDSVVPASEVETPAPDWKGEEGKGEDSGTASAAPPRPKRWKRIPGDWVPRPEDGAKHAARGVDLQLEEEKIRDWEYAEWRTDPDAAWRTWLRRANPTLPASGTMRTAVVLDDASAEGWS